MKKNKIQENYLDRIPIRAEIAWSKDESGLVTLHIENKGAFNRIAQTLLKKPKTSYIHLDEIGSFVWPQLDGEKTILELGELVDEMFGEAARPLYERLAKYFQILESYDFVKFKQ